MRRLRTGDHHVPPYRQKNHGDIANIAIRIQQLKELDQEPQTIWHDPQASNNKRPEVQAMVLVERNQDQDNEFNGIVKRKAN